MDKKKIILIGKDAEDYNCLKSLGNCANVSELSQLQKALQEGSPNLLVVDVSCLRPESANTFKRILDNRKGMDPFIVIIGNEGDWGRIDSGLRESVDDILYRPLTPEKVETSLAMAKNWMGRLDKIKRQSDVSKNLFRIVAHDVSNLFINFELLLRSFDKGKDPEVIKKRQTRAKKTMSEVRELLRNVKTLDAMRSESLVLKLSPVSIHECLEKIKDVYADRLDSKGLSLEVEWNVPKDTQIMADAVSLKHQVLGNILTNAIKFSYPGSVIKLVVSRSGDCTSISIKDTGVGMPPDVVKIVFDEEKSKSREGTSGETGTGYGMPLAFRFVKAYHGKIEVNSTCERLGSEEQGTTFIVSVPTVSKKVA